MKQILLKIREQDRLCRIAGAFGGLLLGIPNMYPALAPLQAIALIPVFYLAASGKVRSRGMLVAGLYMGLAYTLPQLFALRLPLQMSALLMCWLVIIMIAAVWTCGKLIVGPDVLGAFIVGAMLVVLDWVNFTAVGIWGTAQSLVRPWSRYPELIQFVSLTGITGVVFILGAIQALFVKFIVFPQLRGRLIVAVAGVILILSAVNGIIYSRRPAGRIKAASIGWTTDNTAECGDVYSTRGFDMLIASPVVQAAQKGARFIVCPELALQVSDANRKQWLEKLSQITRSHNVFLAVGYLDLTKNENRAMFVAPSGEVIGEYTKTYLTVFENFNKGNGRLVQVDVDGFAAGAMICQDDNFTRFSREYGRGKVSLVAVPTLDWRQVKDAHLQNSIWRAIESQYAVVRAAMNGISAIVSPDGKILAMKDHFKEGPGFIVAETPLYSGCSLFSYLGHWPIVPSIVLLVIYIIPLIKERRICTISNVC
jgi:apolipoprotein N-acyltransferase